MERCQSWHAGMISRWAYWCLENKRIGFCSLKAQEISFKYRHHLKRFKRHKWDNCWNPWRVWRWKIIWWEMLHWRCWDPLLNLIDVSEKYLRYKREISSNVPSGVSNLHASLSQEPWCHQQSLKCPSRAPGWKRGTAVWIGHGTWQYTCLCQLSNQEPESRAPGRSQIHWHDIRAAHVPAVYSQVKTENQIFMARGASVSELTCRWLNKHDNHLEEDLWSISSMSQSTSIYSNKHNN